MSKKIIEQNSKLSFLDCSGCDAKCCQSNLIYASLYDIEKTTNLFPLFFMIQNHKISLVYFFYYGEDNNEYCPYLTNNLCSVYENRPYACRTYPFSNKKTDIYYSTTCPHILENQDSGIKLVKNRQINKQLVKDFITTDFLKNQQDILKMSEEFVNFCNKNNLLIPYEKYYKDKKLYINFKPSIQNKLFIIHPFKIAALRLSGSKLFKENELFLKIIQRLIKAQSNIEKLFNMKNKL